MAVADMNAKAFDRQEALNKLGLEIPKILLPNPEKVDMEKWAVIACDQYTSEPDYWAKVEHLVGEQPSTLNLIFPEVYLDDHKSMNKKRSTSLSEASTQDVEAEETVPLTSAERIAQINFCMQKYEAEQVFAPESECFMLVERQTPNIKSRKGLIVALDLECYDYRRGSQTLIRATEKTIESRLPPRILVRESASVELPHILVLIDDQDCTVIEPLYAQRDKLEQGYHVSLMEGAGTLSGWKVQADPAIDHVVMALEKLSEKQSMLFAMGDGNHSLATAKVCWENLKNSGTIDVNEYHPQRYALVELENIHDAGNQFEPINRLLYGVDVAAMLEKYQLYVEEKLNASFVFHQGRSLAQCEMENKEGNSQFAELISQQYRGTIEVTNSPFLLPLATLQDFLDTVLLQPVEGVVPPKLDYVHGLGAINKVTAEGENNAGFLLPKMEKSDLFPCVINDGALPRKTFSMGHACDKRFYFEGRKIK